MILQIPNACTTLGLPIDIFDFDIRPEAEPKKLSLGSCAYPSSGGGGDEGKTDTGLFTGS